MRILLSVIVMSMLACGSNDASDEQARGSSSGGPGASSSTVSKERRPLATIWGAPTLADENPDPDIVEVHLAAAKARATLVDKEIDVLAYNGTVPGPILQARPGQHVIVHFDNELSDPTTIHWHGLRIPDSMDGSPVMHSPVPAGGTFTYDFHIPEAASFWYHPHVDTNAQLERGLYGGIVIQDDRDPIYDLERYLVLDDVLLDDTGNIAPARTDGFSAMTGRYGNTFLTNGRDAKLAQATAKRGQVERWRLVNAANARRMMLHVEGARVRIIATDGGLLEKPIDVTGEVVLPVGGRLDLEVSYDKAGPVRMLVKDAETPKQMFAVDVADGPDAPRAITWPEVKPTIPERPAKVAYDMSFDFDQTTNEWRINGEAHSMTPLFSVPKGTTMKIRLSNASGGIAHPFHLHGQFFRVLDPAWPGLRDTVMVPESGSVEIIAYLDNPGMWMAHCHILEHAAVGMMTEIMVTGSGTVVSASH
jgi:FtsP/CotA-like multicopper oxidase with cupredoxin domain